MRFGWFVAFLGVLCCGCSAPQVTVAVLTPPVYDISDVRAVGVVAAGSGERHSAIARHIANRIGAVLTQSRIYRCVKVAQLPQNASIPLSADLLGDLSARLGVTHIILIRVRCLDVRMRFDVGPSPCLGSYRWCVSAAMRTSVALYSSGGVLVQSPKTVEVSCVFTSPAIKDERSVVGDLCERTVSQVCRLFCPSCERVRRFLFEDSDSWVAQAADAIIRGDPASAVSHLRIAVERHPKSVPAHYNLAVCLELLATTCLDQGKLEAALAAYREALNHYQTAAKLSHTTHFLQEVSQVSSTVHTLSVILRRGPVGPESRTSDNGGEEERTTSRAAFKGMVSSCEGRR